MTARGHELRRESSEAVAGRAEQAERWRTTADALDAYARLRRIDGDFPEADDIERQAIDYRVAAEALEIGLDAA